MLDGQTECVMEQMFNFVVIIKSKDIPKKENHETFINFVTWLTDQRTE